MYGKKQQNGNHVEQHNKNNGQSNGNRNNRKYNKTNKRNENQDRDENGIVGLNYDNRQSSSGRQSNSQQQGQSWNQNERKENTQLNNQNRNKYIENKIQNLQAFQYQHMNIDKAISVRTAPLAAPLRR